MADKIGGVNFYKLRAQEEAVQLNNKARRLTQRLSSRPDGTGHSSHHLRLPSKMSKEETQATHSSHNMQVGNNILLMRSTSGDNVAIDTSALMESGREPGAQSNKLLDASHIEDESFSLSDVTVAPP